MVVPASRWLGRLASRKTSRHAPGNTRFVWVWVFACLLSGREHEKSPVTVTAGCLLCARSPYLWWNCTRQLLGCAASQMDGMYDLHTYLVPIAYNEESKNFRIFD